MAIKQMLKNVAHKVVDRINEHMEFKRQERILINQARLQGRLEGIRTAAMYKPMVDLGLYEAREESRINNRQTSSSFPFDFPGLGPQTLASIGVNVPQPQEYVEQEYSPYSDKMVGYIRGSYAKVNKIIIYR